MVTSADMRRVLLEALVQALNESTVNNARVEDLCLRLDTLSEALRY